MGKHYVLAAVASAAVLTGSASASVISTFSYSGQATAGQVTGTSGPAFPSGGALRVADPLRNYAVAIGQGAANPFIYAAGAAAAGKASATSNVTVNLQITNTSNEIAMGSLSGLIFGGAVGIANPDFSDPSCPLGAIDTCGVFVDGTPALHAGESASVSYSATLNGAAIFDGSIGVSTAGMFSTFSGVSLNNFGVNPANGNLFSWDETTFSGLSLGFFAPGETKILTFLVAASVATNGQFGCTTALFGCPTALAGFGDPPPGNGGVIVGGGQTLRTAAISASNTTTQSGTGGLIITTFNGLSPFLTVNFGPTRPPSTVPLPGAIYLFGLGLGGLGLGLKRKKKSVSA